MATMQDPSRESDGLGAAAGQGVAVAQPGHPASAAALMVERQEEEEEEEFLSVTEALPYDIVLHILGFAGWQERVALFGASRYYASLLEHESTWHWMCQQLPLSSFIHCPSHLWMESWRAQFLYLYGCRRRFDVDMEPESASTSIRVCARFRPLASASAGAEGEEAERAAAAVAAAEEVIIPLHQRLQMIRAQHQCSSSEARRILWGRSACDPWAQATIPLADRSNVDDAQAQQQDKGSTVAGAEAAESGDGEAAAGSGDGDGELGIGVERAGVLAVSDSKVLLCAPSAGLKQFRFDGVYNDSATQKDIFVRSCSELVTEFLNGLNTTLLCYGQTGSGKTHTMFGPDATTATSLDVSARSGIVPRACHEIMGAVRVRRALGMEVGVSMAYVEVFAEEVFNLLDQGERVGAWRGTAARAVERGDADIEIGSVRELEQLLARGEAAKRRAATAMNERSSRAHSLCFITLKQVHPETGAQLRSRICFADLGGSEQIKKSKVSGERLAEAVQINLGLLALKNCIKALHRERSHVPFQDSRLTTLLENSLGGNSRSLVFVTGSMDPTHVSETMHALRFGAVCRRIENEGGIELTAGNAVLEALEREIETLEQRIQKEERWVTRVISRPDFDGQMEHQYITVPVGAEHLRKRYEELLATKDKLGGKAVGAAAEAAQTVLGLEPEAAAAASAATPVAVAAQ